MCFQSILPTNCLHFAFPGIVYMKAFFPLKVVGWSGFMPRKQEETIERHFELLINKFRKDLNLNF
jgi:hypothetical protein